MNKIYQFDYEFVPGQDQSVNLINRSSRPLWILSRYGVPNKVQPNQRLLAISGKGSSRNGSDCVVNLNFSLVEGIDFDPEPGLQHNLLDLLNQKKFSDFKLTVGDFEFPCHKAILAARSPVLAGAFQFRTDDNDHLEIKGFEPATMNSLLNYLYSGRVSDDVHELADFLGIDIEQRRAPEMELRPLNIQEPEGIQVLQDQNLQEMHISLASDLHLEPSFGGMQTRMNWTIPEFEAWRVLRPPDHVERQPDVRLTLLDQEFIFGFELHLDQLFQPLTQLNRPRRLFRLVNRSPTQVVIRGDNSDFLPKVILPGGYLIADWWYKMQGNDLKVSYTFTILMDLDQDCHLQQDMLNLLNEGQFSDFKLKCGEVEFPCHKAILAARSPTLAQALEGHPEAGEQEIEDFQSDTVKQALEFIYSGTLSGEADQDLLRLALYLKNKDLIKACERSLAKTVTSANVFDLLDLADTGCRYLRNSVLAFCAHNHQELKDTQQWIEKVSNDSRLLQEMLDFKNYRNYTNESPLLFFLSN